MGRAGADELPMQSDLDGLYLTIGPVAAGARVADEWRSAVGLELSLVAVREHAFPAGFGMAAGGVSYGGAPGGRLWLEAEAALAPPLPVAVGLGAGLAAEVDRIEPPRLGAQATLWIFAGLVPYVRVGVLEHRGRFIEIGAMIKVPLPRLARW